MITINIAPIIKEACPNIRLACIQANVKIVDHAPKLWEHIHEVIKERQAKLETTGIAQIAPIQQARKAYKVLGKDPARYRLSAEALLRRVVKKKDLYQINNVVDIINLASIKSGFSIGGYDVDLLNGTLHLGKGKENEPYQAIGRGTLNIHCLPVLRDETGAFGSPTSDSTRTAINANTKKVLLVFFDFGGDEGLEAALADTERLLGEFA